MLSALLTTVTWRRSITLLGMTAPGCAANFHPIKHRRLAGEVWANLLHHVYAAVVGDLGFYKTGHTAPLAQRAASSTAPLP
jgi:hypothetical protein